MGAVMMTFENRKDMLDALICSDKGNCLVCNRCTGVRPTESASIAYQNECGNMKMKLDLACVVNITFLRLVQYIRSTIPYFRRRRADSEVLL